MRVKILKQQPNAEFVSQNRIFFWGAYLVTVLVLLFRGPELTVPLWNIGNDDAMRLVQVRDFLNGQGWFDTMQHRLGFEGGTAIHWSRLVDLPIAALLWVFSLGLSQDMAEAATLILWPLLVLGPTLWAMHRATLAYGGIMGGFFGLLFTMFAIIVSQKFTPGILDHHNVQMMLMALVLMAMMTSKSQLKNGVIAGFCTALSLTIGLETMPFVALICLSVALIWVWNGALVRSETIGFAALFAGTFALVFIATRPDLALTNFRCDAFGRDLLFIGVVGAGGLLALASFASNLSLTLRIGGMLALGVGIIIFAKLVAPSCLADPYAQLYPDVVSDWLSRITEAQSLATSIKTGGGSNFGLAIIPILAILFALNIARDSAFRQRSLVLVGVIIAAYALTFYQIRGLFFLLLLCAVPISATLGQLYTQYKIDQKPLAGILVLVVMLASMPDIWSLGYIQWKAFQSNRVVASDATQTTLVTAHTQRNAVAHLNSCFRPVQVAKLRGLPVGVVVASTDLGAGLIRATDHRLMAANFHRNQDGIQALLQVSKAAVDDTAVLLADMHADYVVICLNDFLPLQISPENGLWPMLYRGAVPAFLTPVPADENDLLRIYKTNR